MKLTMADSSLSVLRKRISDRIGRMIDWRINNPLAGNRLDETYRSVEEYRRLVPEHRARPA